jgi:hypothetical protein
VAAQVKLKLMAEQERRLTGNRVQNPEAYDCSPRAYHLARYNLTDAQKAVGYFRTQLNVILRMD